MLADSSMSVAIRVPTICVLGVAASACKPRLAPAKPRAPTATTAPQLGTYGTHGCQRLDADAILLCCVDPSVRMVVQRKKQNRNLQPIEQNIKQVASFRDAESLPEGRGIVVGIPKDDLRHRKTQHGSVIHTETSVSLEMNGMAEVARAGSWDERRHENGVVLWSLR